MTPILTLAVPVTAEAWRRWGWTSNAGADVPQGVVVDAAVAVAQTVARARLAAHLSPDTAEIVSREIAAGVLDGLLAEANGQYDWSVWDAEYCGQAEANHGA